MQVFLTKSLVDYGIEITPTSQRLATFNSVENTYLTVFMALSGLGFIIGTIGLGIVLLRNVYERRQELALMLSLGYSQKQVFKIVFTENFYPTGQQDSSPACWQPLLVFYHPFFLPPLMCRVDF